MGWGDGVVFADVSTQIAATVRLLLYIAARHYCIYGGREIKKREAVRLRDESGILLAQKRWRRLEGLPFLLL